METPYKKALGKFQASEEYKRLIHLAKIESRIDEKYLINRIRAAFDAGWRAAETKLIY